MLVLKKVKKHEIIVYDTITGEMKPERADNESVLGVVRYEGKLYHIVVDDMLWRLMDLVDKPASISTGCWLSTVRKYNFEMLNDSDFVSVYKDYSTGIFILNYMCDLIPLDDNCIFWRLESDAWTRPRCCTLFDIYKTAYSLIDEEPRTILVKSINGVYSLDLNRDENTFMTKVKVLC